MNKDEVLRLLDILVTDEWSHEDLWELIEYSIKKRESEYHGYSFQVGVEIIENVTKRLADYYISDFLTDETYQKVRDELSCKVDEYKKQEKEHWSNT